MRQTPPQESAIASADVDAVLHSTPYRFSDWPNKEVPNFAAGVYTVWDQQDRFIYVGMSGRHIDTETPLTNRPHGLITRLSSHASGRRSGDQFCVYVGDRLVLPLLSRQEIENIASGQASFDHLIRRYIHDHFRYRFMVTPTGLRARRLEAFLKSGKSSAGLPLLNPSR